MIKIIKQFIDLANDTALVIDDSIDGISKLTEHIKIYNADDGDTKSITFLCSKNNSKEIHIKLYSNIIELPFKWTSKELNELHAICKYELNNYIKEQNNE